MELVRNRHFKAYIEKLYVGLMARHKGVSESVARATFHDTYMEDANLLTYILNSTYSNTKCVDDEYWFITKDDFFHTDIETKEVYQCGAMTLKFNKDFSVHVSFDNKNFKHGQISNENGTIKCYGGFKQFPQSMLEIGFTGMLMDIYNFARVSNHDTHWLVEA